MVSSHVIARAAGEETLKERCWRQCGHCGEKFEYYRQMFSQQKETVCCPHCGKETVAAEVLD
jgi:hypothetical protein